MTYNCNITQKEGKYLVQFSDVPNAITLGFTHEEALFMAGDVLNGTSKNELKTIGTVTVIEEYENTIKLLKESSKILYQTANFTVFIHFCFFAVGVLIALIIAQYSVIGALVEIARKLGGFSIMVVIPQLIVCGAFKKLQIAAFN